MSVDNVARQGTSGLDESLPSHYALEVGDIDVLVISDGVLSMPSPMLATNADPAVRASWLDDMFLPPDDLALPLNQVVVRSGDRTILIDAGAGLDHQDFTPRAGRWALRLQAAGIDLASVTDVVLTHMHFDHVGGLLIDGVKDCLRADLRIHAAAAEAEFWESPDFSHTAVTAPVQDAMRSSASRFLDQYRDQLRPFETEYEVAPGVLVQRTGGHTPGHSVVRLASGGEGLTFAGDAVLPGRVRPPGLVQRIRTRSRGGCPRQGRSPEGAGIDPRGAGGHSSAVPVRLPRGGRRRRLSCRTGRLGLLTVPALRCGTAAESSSERWWRTDRRKHVLIAGAVRLIRNCRNGPLLSRRGRFESTFAIPLLRCQHATPKWVGRCANCGTWGTVDEVAVLALSDRVGGAVRRSVAPTSPAVPITSIDPGITRHYATGVSELDRVLGGGLVAGSVTLLAGDPGVGKSTLLLEVANRWAHTGRRALYLSGEESAGQIRLRAERTGCTHDNVYLARRIRSADRPRSHRRGQTQSRGGRFGADHVHHRG